MKMKNKSFALELNNVIHQQNISDNDTSLLSDLIPNYIDSDSKTNTEEILFITSYPPRECGIATYSQDLVKSLNNKFSNSFSIKVCALESNETTFDYPDEVKYTLKTSLAEEYEEMASSINLDINIKIVLIQHEFGFFHKQESAFLKFLQAITKPVVIVFHTVLPHPDEQLLLKIKGIDSACNSIVVMTHRSADILINEYGVQEQKITVIAHGTHLVPHLSEKFLKDKYELSGRKVITTFGLLSSGKGIETAIEALPEIIVNNPEVIFLVIGKTHPEVVKNEGEKYREMLEQKVEQLSLANYVRFINTYLPLPELLEYLQLTDIYLFTANDPNQAVSGTFVYAMSCACPIISTPIPHALELLNEETGIIFDFRNSRQLAQAVIKLINDEPLRKNMSLNVLHKIVTTAWENSAIEHALLFEKIAGEEFKFQNNNPEINLNHIYKMSTGLGIIQFSKKNQPDIETGYTLDDNARALIAICIHYKLTTDELDLHLINQYIHFIEHCMQPGGNFLNYVDKYNNFTKQNDAVNLDDSNGRALWALGYVVSLTGLLPQEITERAERIFEKAMQHISKIYSTRAMAFTIKGIYYFDIAWKSPENLAVLKTFSDRLVEMYRHESNEKWKWFEAYLTYANSILPEAMLYAWLITGDSKYKEIAISSFNFLLSQTFNENGIEVISNKTWLQKGQVASQFGEQAIDVANTVMSLSKFYDVLKDEEYLLKMKIAFNWFLGNNRLHQIIYNPRTGGCYDGLEETHVNLNQGAESTISYLMARLTIENYKNSQKLLKVKLRNHFRTHSNNSKLIYSTHDETQMNLNASGC